MLDRARKKKVWGWRKNDIINDSRKFNALADRWNVGWL
jgi:hypothetical protein